MTQQQHTPEPWKVSDKSKRVISYGHDEVVINSEANARRISACINACAGLDTEYLETVGLPEFAGKQLCADMVQQELDAVTAQRDQLLEHSEKMAKLLAMFFNYCPHEVKVKFADDCQEEAFCIGDELKKQGYLMVFNKFYKQQQSEFREGEQ